MKKGDLNCSNEEHEISATFIHLVNKPSEVLFCQECIIDSVVTKGSLICVKDCVLKNTKNIDKIISNWPPGIDPLLTTKLREYSKQNYMEYKITEANKFFDELIEITLKKIAIRRKKCLQEIEKGFLDSNGFIEAYNTISQRQKLANIIEGEDIEVNLAKFLGEMLEIKEKNILELKKLIPQNEEELKQSTDLTREAINNLLDQISQLENIKLIPVFLTKSKYSDSSQFTLKVNTKGSRANIRNNRQSGFLYTDFVLENEKKYIVRFKLSLSLSQMNYTSFGLISQNTIDSNLSSYGNFLSSSHQSLLEDKSDFWLFDSTSLHAQSIREIEMRVCISDNVLIFSDYPNYLTQNFKLGRENSKSPIEINNKWRIFVFMSGNTNKEVAVHYFQEVQEFPPIQKQQPLASI